MLGFSPARLPSAFLKVKTNGYRLTQTRSVWYWYNGSEKIGHFSDGDTINASGALAYSGDRQLGEEKDRAMLKRIDKYAKLYGKALPLDRPSNGDGWGWRVNSGLPDEGVGQDRMNSITEKKLDCGHEPSPHADFTTGYGVDRDGKKICYACCAENDRKQMRETGRATLYLTSEPNEGNLSADHFVSNWPGSLKFRAHYYKVGRHNMTGRRYDVWFTFENQPWHGVQYGDNTQVVHCNRIKS